jgi:peptide/nickel transport system substrate-binding protein
VNRQPRTLLSVLLVAAVLAIGWLIYRDLHPAPIDTPTSSLAPTRGGTLRASLRSEPRSFNRITHASIATALYSTLTQGKLVRINPATQEIEPVLAEKWEASADGRTYTLTLRDGVTWSDGTPFTSADVLFSLRASYDPKAASVLASVLTINRSPITASAPDARTVVINYPAPFGPGIGLLDNLYLLPEHKLAAALEAGTFPKAWLASTSPSELASIGPFQLTRYDPGQRLVFDRNPKYWKKDAKGQSLPYLDQVVLEIVPDQNAEIVRLQAGEIDMLQQHVRAEDIGTLKPLVSQNALKMIELGVSTDPDAFFFNLRPAQWTKDRRGSWMSKREFRQAISYAVDREAFANTVYLGAAVPIWGPISPGNTNWFSPNVPRYGFSLEKASALLTGLGLSNRDADQWLEDAAGTEARFTVLTFKGNTALLSSAAMLRDDLQHVGIAVDIVPLEQGALLDRMMKGDFEAIYLNLFMSSLDPALSSDYWLSSGAAHIWNIGQTSPATDWEKQIDELMTRQAATVDQAERKRIFNDVQKIFAEQLPALYFVAPRMYMAVTARVGNLTPAVIRPQLLWAADTITVQPSASSSGPH